jgi:NitT/TauT family transport system substrate-binding protein
MSGNGFGVSAVVRRLSILLFGVLSSIPVAIPISRAEVSEVQIAYQFGLVYLPLMVMQKEQLFEKQAARLGLGQVKSQYSVLSGGNTMNDALLSGSIHFAAGGVAPFLTLWGKTTGTPAEVKGVAGFTASNMYLLTNNANVKSIRDLSDRDRIAVPAVKVSIQALVLQMAAAQAFGDAEYAKLDALTVAVPNPEAMAALLSGGTGSGVNSNFTAPPYSNEALANPKIKTVLTAYDVLGGSTVLDVVWATSKFRQANPRTFEAFLAALKDSIAFINKNKAAAARIYIEMQGKSYSEKHVLEILNASNQGIPDVEFTLDPKRITKYSDFLHKTGRLPIRPSSWKDMFFPNAHDLVGS